MAKNKTNDRTIDALSLADLQRAAAKALALVEQLREVLPELEALTDDERRGSLGHIRAGEGVALRAVLSAVDLRPELFASLADQDEGHDAGRFETDLLRDRLDRRTALAPLTDELTKLSADLSDTVLALGARARGPVLAAYAIAKSVSQSDAKLRAKLTPALDYYGAIARKGAATRKKKTAK